MSSLEIEIAICIFTTFGFCLGGYYVGIREGSYYSEKRAQRLVEALRVRCILLRNRNRQMAILRTLIVRIAPHGSDCRPDDKRKCTCWKADAMEVLGINGE